jgi:hypothetical protein
MSRRRVNGTVISITASRIDDNERPGRSSTSITDNNVYCADDRVREDRRIKLTDIAHEQGLSLSSEPSTVQHQLDYRKVCVRWVSKNLRQTQSSSYVTLWDAFDTSRLSGRVVSAVHCYRR